MLREEFHPESERTTAGRMSSHQPDVGSAAVDNTTEFMNSTLNGGVELVT